MNIKKNLSIDSSLNELTLESENLFKILDDISSTICKTEKVLHDQKMYFPYTLEIKEEEISPIYKLKDSHNFSAPSIQGYCTQICWYLSWDYDDDSKKYCICLLFEEKELIAFEYDECAVQFKEVQSKCTFKKPLVETNLQIRLQFAEHITPFINSLTDHLASIRLKIEKNYKIIEQ